MLCGKGSQTLQSKSINVEDAANELIEMLCTYEPEEEEEEEHKDDLEQEAEDNEGQGQLGVRVIGEKLGLFRPLA